MRNIKEAGASRRSERGGCGNQVREMSREGRIMQKLGGHREDLGFYPK